MDPAILHMIAAFCQRQLSQILDNGVAIGLSPVTTASTMMQICASSMYGIAPAQTVAMLRAYADTLEAGPHDTPAKQAAVAAFEAAASDFVAIAAASRNFPAPQGSA